MLHLPLTARPAGRVRRPAGLALAALLAGGSGCEKVVTLPLRTSPAQLVIEGSLADDNQPCRVQLSRSASYDEPNAFVAVSGATVTLTDDVGSQETLPEGPAGQYVGSRLRGVPGRTYALRVVEAGTTYEAHTTLPNPVVPLDGLRVTAGTGGAGPGGGRVAEVAYADPAGPGNRYVFRLTRNGVLSPTIYVQSDQGTDGQPVSLDLRTPGSGTGSLAAGDSVVVEMQNVDDGVYEYFRTLSQLQQANPLFSTTPANPTSNFSGGALGYFSAHSRRVRRLRVP